MEDVKEMATILQQRKSAQTLVEVVVLLEIWVLKSLNKAFLDLPQDICAHPEDNGECTGELQRWRYDSTHQICKPFVYTGCGGNGNNFDSEADCRSACDKGMIHS